MRKEDKILKVQTALPLCIVVGLVVGSLTHQVLTWFFIGCVAGVALRAYLKQRDNSETKDSEDSGKTNE